MGNPFFFFKELIILRGLHNKELISFQCLFFLVHLICYKKVFCYSMWIVIVIDNGNN